MAGAPIDELPQIAHPRGLKGRLIAHGMSLWNSPVYRMVASRLELRPDDDLLDIGCGAGLFLRRHGGVARSVAGLDASADMVAVARFHLRQRIARGEAEVQQGDATRLPWPDGRFSAVASMEVIYFIDDVPAFFAEVFRVLRAPGRFALGVEWTADDSRDRSKQASRYGMKLYRINALEEGLRRAGFENIEATRGGGFWSKEALVLRATKAPGPPA